MVSPPIAMKKPHEITMHNDTRVDNYYWLKEKTDPEVIEYLNLENKYTQEVMAHTVELQKEIYDEMVGRIQETDTSPLIEYGGYYYYHRTEEGKQYPIYCRKKVSAESEEIILLDMNKVAEENNFKYLRLGVYKISPNHKLLAYSLDVDGSEKYTINIMNMENGEILSDELKNTSYSFEWAEDNTTFFYSTQDEAKRTDKLWRHRLGTTQCDDALIFHEKDQLYSLHLSKTRDHKYLILMIGSIETTENHFLRADSPSNMFKLIHPREKGLRYFVDHKDEEFYIVTNLEDCKNNRVMKASVNDFSKEKWIEFIPHNTEIKIDSVSLFKDHIVLYERENGLRTIKIINEKEETYYVTFPEPVYTYNEVSNPEYETTRLRLNYTSLTTANSTFEYEMNKKEWTLIKRQPVLGGYTPEDYVTERIWAEAQDGEKIPISVVYRKGTVKNGENPCILYGYGSYGASVDPAFNSGRLSLLDRGFIFAIAHIRGGGEMGREWYEQGKFLNKINTFTDYIACAKHLIKLQYTNPEKLVAVGRSAGGLLMGAVTNMAPELFKAVVAGVPFVDVITTMLDESIPLTVGEFEEWGNPKEKEFYDYMLKYSPYDNVESKQYPNILVTAGLNDPRVQYWEPAKWVAKLRAVKTDNNRLLFKIFMGAGHFSSSGRYDYLKDTAFEYAYILDTIGGVTG